MSENFNPQIFIRKSFGQANIRNINHLIPLSSISKAIEQYQKGKLNDRALFLSVLSELIYKYYYFLQIKSNQFFKSICFQPKATRRIKNQDDYEVVRKTKKTKKNPNISIDQMANDATRDNANIEIRRRNDDSNVQSKKSSDASRPQLPLPVDINFKKQLQQIGNEYPQPNTDFDVNLQPVDIQSSQNISSNSSQFSKLGIPKLAQKLKILGNNLGYKKQTTKRNRKNDNTIATKKKGKTIIDQQINLQTTRINNNDITLQQMDTKKSKYLSRQIQNQINMRINEIIKVQTNIQQIIKLNQIHRNKYHQGQSQFQINPYQYDFSQPTQNIYAPPNTNSRFQFPSQDIKLSNINFDSNIFRSQQKLTVKNIAKNTDNKIHEIFLKMLWLAQQGTVTLHQQNPQIFGDIYVNKMISL